MYDMNDSVFLFEDLLRPNKENLRNNLNGTILQKCLKIIKSRHFLEKQNDIRCLVFREKKQKNICIWA